MISEEAHEVGLSGRRPAPLSPAYKSSVKRAPQKPLVPMRHTLPVRNVSEAAGAKALQLSGGEQQMLSMARTLLGKPSLLLLDEPLEGLAPVICDELMEMIFHLASSGDITVVLVEQQIERALDFADRVLILERDRQAWLGPSNELRSNRDLVDRLLGVGIH